MDEENKEDCCLSCEFAEILTDLVDMADELRQETKNNKNKNIQELSNGVYNASIALAITLAKASFIKLGVERSIEESCDSCNCEACAADKGSN